MLYRAFFNACTRKMVLVTFGFAAADARAGAGVSVNRWAFRGALR
jgi:hypothetical protein